MIPENSGTKFKKKTKQKNYDVSIMKLIQYGIHTLFNKGWVASINLDNHGDQDANPQSKSQNPNKVQVEESQVGISQCW